METHPATGTAGGKEKVSLYGGWWGHLEQKGALMVVWTAVLHPTALLKGLTWPE